MVFHGGGWGKRRCNSQEFKPSNLAVPSPTRWSQAWLHNCHRLPLWNRLWLRRVSNRCVVLLHCISWNTCGMLKWNMEMITHWAVDGDCKQVSLVPSNGASLLIIRRMIADIRRQFPFKDVVKNLFNPLDFQSDPQFVLQRRTWHHFHLKQLPFRDAQEKTKSIPWRWYQKPLISLYFHWIPQYPHHCPRGSPLFSTFFLDGPLSWHQWYQMKVGFVRFGLKRNPKIIDYNCHDKNIKTN